MSSPPSDARRLIGLDDIDARIVSLLQTDGRMSARAMARDLGMSHKAVGARLDQLLERGAVTVVGIADPTLIGPQVLAVVHIATDGRPGVWDRIAEVGPLNWLVQFDDLSTGLAQMGTDRLTDVLRAVDDELRPIPGVLRAEVSVGLRFHTRTGPLAAPEAEHHPIPAPIDVDDADRTMMQALHDDGRVTITDMAAMIGRSAPATRQRLDRLLRNGAVEIRAVVDPALTGRSIRAAFAITLCDAGVAVVTSLLTFDETEVVAESGGRYDIWCEVACESDERLLAMWHRIRTSGPVADVRMFRYHRLVKDTRIWF